MNELHKKKNIQVLYPTKIVMSVRYKAKPTHVKDVNVDMLQ